MSEPTSTTPETLEASVVTSLLDKKRSERAALEASHKDLLEQIEHRETQFKKEQEVFVQLVAKNQRTHRELSGAIAALEALFAPAPIPAPAPLSAPAPIPADTQAPTAIAG